MYFLASETSQCFLVSLLSHDFMVLSALPTSVTLMLYSACKITVLKKKPLDYLVQVLVEAL